MKRKKILVTGGAGFLGSHLCGRLIGLGHEVICLDNLSTGSKSHLIKSDSYRFIEQDVCLPIDLEVDEIYNLACPASPRHYQQDPIQTVKTCVIGAMNVLELGRKWGAKVFQASTSEVYGDPLVHPQVESDWGHVNPIGIRACYDEGKRCAETLFFDYGRTYGVKIRVARIFNTYGPGMGLDDGRVVTNFIGQALRGDPLTIYGQGQQTRSFCYVDDLVEGMIQLMGSSVVGPVNLGNPCECSMLELAREILFLTGSKSKLVFQELPLDDPRQRCPDISKAREVLGWEPKISLREGLLKTIHYLSQQS